MSEKRLKGPVELSVAADAGMMLVIRLTTAGVVARAGLTIDAMDSLKIATEEACNCLIGQENPPERITLRFLCEDDRTLVIRAIAGDSEAGEGGMDETELEIVRCILAALADEVSFDMRCGRIHAIELRVALTQEG